MDTLFSLDRQLEEESSSLFTLSSLRPLEDFDWNGDLPEFTSDSFKDPLFAIKDDGLILQNLNLFGDDKIGDPFSFVENDISSIGSQTDTQDDIAVDDNDALWTLENIDGSAAIQNEIWTWDTFPDSSKRRRWPVCLSEAGPLGLDAALRLQATKSGLEDSGRVVRADAFISSLFKLGLGWNSVFFRYNEQSRVFESDIRDARISGTSLPSLNELIERILFCGTWIRRLKQFIATVSAMQDAPRSLASFSRVIFVLLYALEDRLNSHAKLNPTLIETQMLFWRAGCLIECLSDIAYGVAKVSGDKDIISVIIAKCDHYSHQYVWLTDIFHKIIGITSSQWLSRVALWTGIRPLLIEANGFEEVNSGTAYIVGTDTSNFSPEAMPDFISSEDAELIYETGTTLGVLRSSLSDHPLLGIPLGVMNSSSTPLEVGLTWDDIDRIQQKASSYESQLRGEILKYTRTIGSSTVRHAQADNKFDEYSSDQPTIDSVYELTDIDSSQDTPDRRDTDHPSNSELYSLLVNGSCIDITKDLNSDQEFGPPLASAFSLSLTPILLVQSRLVNFSCLHLLFTVHKAKEHLQLQKQFQLLSNSEFMMRLSLTLFDPNMHSGERKRGVARGGSATGLRLGNRDTWPPATSELRLVLTGLLSECYNKSQSGKPHVDRAQGELPGGLSFAIRDLVGKDLLKCRNSHSLEALDFLKIQYIPPPVLGEIITSSSLSKYDMVFKHLLRLTRMLFVVRQLVRASSERQRYYNRLPAFDQKFRFEALHFVQTMSDYCFQVGVNRSWKVFERLLSKIERCVGKGDIDGAIFYAKSVHRLREYHEDTLEKIIDTLLLSKRHDQSRKMLEECFHLILSFSFYRRPTNEDHLGTQASHDQSVRELYLRFSSHVGEFIRCLKRSNNESDRRYSEEEQSDPLIDTDMDVIQFLILQLDMNDFYS